MARRVPPRPTERELAILKVLWRRGPSTVRQVHEALASGRPTGYTTALKTMQIMHEKGLVKRDESERTHVYRPAIPADKTLRQLTGDLLERAFGGSAAALVMHALQAKQVSPDELREIRELLNELEESER